MKRPTNSQRFECRREVAILARKGWSQAAIARHLQVSPATVGYIRQLVVVNTSAGRPPFGRSLLPKGTSGAGSRNVLAHDAIGASGEGMAAFVWIRRRTRSPPGRRDLLLSRSIRHPHHQSTDALATVSRDLADMRTRNDRGHWPRNHRLQSDQRLQKDK